MESRQMPNLTAMSPESGYQQELAFRLREGGTKGSLDGI